MDPNSKPAKIDKHTKKRIKRWRILFFCLVSENELKNLRISFEREQSRAVEMEKQLAAFQASCSCLKGLISISDPIEANTSGICCNGFLGTVTTMPDDVDVDHMPLSCSTRPDIAYTNPFPTNSDASFGQSHATSVLVLRMLRCQ